MPKKNPKVTSLVIDSEAGTAIIKIERYPRVGQNNTHSTDLPKDMWLALNAWTLDGLMPEDEADTDGE